MPNPYFKFKQFTVWQDKCAMKVGTDGVLLGAWAGGNCTPQRVLDIGTGTGLIALMMAQRYSAMVDAVEIEESAAGQARENIDKSKWCNLIKVHQQAIQYFKPDYQYDLVVTNPPYFTNSLQAATNERSLARHNHQLNLSDLLQSVNKMLNPRGVFALIVPYDSYQNLKIEAEKCSLREKRICYIKTTPNVDVKRVMVEFTFDSPLQVFEEILIVEAHGRHQYSEEYRKLTREFYLKF